MVHLRLLGVSFEEIGTDILSDDGEDNGIDAI